MVVEVRITILPNPQYFFFSAGRIPVFYRRCRGLVKRCTFFAVRRMDYFFKYLTKRDEYQRRTNFTRRPEKI